MLKIVTILEASGWVRQFLLKLFTYLSRLLITGRTQTSDADLDPNCLTFDGIHAILFRQI